MQRGAAPTRSIIDDLGEEVTAIVTPVSICMALTVSAQCPVSLERVPQPCSSAITFVEEGASSLVA